MWWARGEPRPPSAGTRDMVCVCMVVALVALVALGVSGQLVQARMDPVLFAEQGNYNDAVVFSEHRMKRSMGSDC